MTLALRYDSLQALPDNIGRSLEKAAGKLLLWLELKILRLSMKSRLRISLLERIKSESACGSAAEKAFSGPVRDQITQEKNKFGLGGEKIASGSGKPYCTS